VAIGLHVQYTIVGMEKTNVLIKIIIYFVLFALCCFYFGYVTVMGILRELGIFENQYSLGNFFGIIVGIFGVFGSLMFLVLAIINLVKYMRISVLFGFKISPIDNENVPGLVLSVALT
jgi:hypothetical protein